jgi:hypothetical protein
LVVWKKGRGKKRGHEKRGRLGKKGVEILELKSKQTNKTNNATQYQIPSY